MELEEDDPVGDTLRADGRLALESGSVAGRGGGGGGRGAGGGGFRMKPSEAKFLLLKAVNTPPLVLGEPA